MIDPNDFKSKRIPLMESRTVGYPDLNSIVPGLGPLDRDDLSRFEEEGGKSQSASDMSVCRRKKRVNKIAGTPKRS
jgi:hypothetical protein